MNEDNEQLRSELGELVLEIYDAEQCVRSASHASAQAEFALKKVGRGRTKLPGAFAGMGEEELREKLVVHGLELFDAKQHLAHLKSRRKAVEGKLRKAADLSLGCP